jgi:dipeptidyl-peptidase-4
LNSDSDLHFLKKQDAFLWTSERDGFSHVYKVDKATGASTQLTTGPWQVTSISFVDEDAGLVYFMGN